MLDVVVDGSGGRTVDEEEVVEGAGGGIFVRLVFGGSC